MPRQFGGGGNREGRGGTARGAPLTCRSEKWYWQSFFHSSRSSLSTCRSGATWPRLTRSRPSLSRCMMFSCRHKGRSVKVRPLKAGCGEKDEVKVQVVGGGQQITR